MPPAGTEVDPDALLRSAISGIAVAAHARGIGIAAHVDLKLPVRLTSVSGGLGRFLSRGLRRTLEAGQIRKIAVALWLDGHEPDGTVRMLVEVCRQFSGEVRPAAPLAHLWALPLGVGHAAPRPVRDEAMVESVVIPVIMAPAPELAAASAEQNNVRWRSALRGRRFLETRDILYDRARLRASVESVGARMEFAGTLREALALMRAGVAEGQPVAVAAVGGTISGLDPVEFARQVRADPALAGTRLILASSPDGDPQAEDIATLFDAVSLGAGPRRRMLDVVYELIRTEDALLGAAPKHRPAGAIPVLGGRRVLIAEDVETNQVLLQAILAPTGAAIEVVENGARAVERHRADPADLILMDLQMPGVGGIAALKKIREMQGVAGTVPVLALTACALNSDRRKALEAGMDGYLAKPILVEEFYAALRRFLLPTEAG